MAFTGNAAVVSSHPALRLLSKSTNQTAFVAATQATPDGGGGTFAYVASDTSSGCLFTGSVSGTTLTVSASPPPNGILVIGLSINRGDTGASIGRVLSFGTGTGGAGTYTLSAPASIAGPLTFTADNDSSFIVATDGGRWFNVGNYQQSAAEISAGVTPTNYTYGPDHIGADIRRYGNVDLTGATDCRAILNTANSIGNALYFPKGVYRVSTNLTLSVALIFEQGAIFKPDAGVVITITNNIIAGPWQIFDVSNTPATASPTSNPALQNGTTPIVGPAQVERIYAEWFGAAGNGSTDDYAAWQGAANFALSCGGTPIYLQTKNYVLSNTLYLMGSAKQAGPVAVSLRGCRLQPMALPRARPSRTTALPPPKLWCASEVPTRQRMSGAASAGFSSRGHGLIRLGWNGPDVWGSTPGIASSSSFSMLACGTTMWMPGPTPNIAVSIIAPSSPVPSRVIITAPPTPSMAVDSRTATRSISIR